MAKILKDAVRESDVPKRGGELRLPTARDISNAIDRVLGSPERRARLQRHARIEARSWELASRRIIR